MARAQVLGQAGVGDGTGESAELAESESEPTDPQELEDEAIAATLRSFAGSQKG